MLRWKETGSSAPPGLQQLLRKAPPTPPMTESEKARITARVMQYSAVPTAAAPLIAAPKIAGIIIGLGGVAALLANALPSTSNTGRCDPPPASASHSSAPTMPPQLEESGPKSIETASNQTTGSPKRDEVQEPKPAENVAGVIDTAPLHQANHSERVPIASVKAANPNSRPLSAEKQALQDKPMAAVEPTIASSATSATTASSAASPTDPENQLKLESRLIREAEKALETSPGDALVRLDEHAESFPQGVLADEREFLAVSALVKLGRHAEARKRARALLRQNNSSYKEWVQQLLTTIPNDDSNR